MRHPVPTLATIVTAAALVAGCGGGTDAPTGPAAPIALVIDFDYIDVIQDCDGVEGRGDFTFTLYARQKNFNDEQVWKVSRSLGPGERVIVGNARKFLIPAAEGDSFVDVGFEATEWDKNIFGTVYADSRLDGAYDLIQHKLTNGTWSRLGTQTITLGTRSLNDCQVRLTYAAHQP
jgi:hypothetical protein